MVAHLHRIAARVVSTFLLALLACHTSFAQEDRWKQLFTQSGQLQDSGRYAEALPIALEAEKIAESTFGPNHAYTSASLNRVATIYNDLGKYSDAEPLLNRAIEIGIKTVGPEHPGVANMLNNLAALYESEARYADAERYYKEALAIHEKALGQNDLGVATDLNNLALLYMKQARYDDAEPLFQRAIAIDEKALGPESPGLAIDLSNLALLYETRGDYAKALPLYKRAVTIDLKKLGAAHPDVANRLHGMAGLASGQGFYGSAEPLLKLAISIDQKAYGPVHPAVAAELNSLALVYIAQGRYSEAEPLLKNALEIDEKLFGPDHPSVAAILLTLASLYESEHRYQDAEPLAKNALVMNVKALGKDSDVVAANLNLLALIYEDQNRYPDAEAFMKRSVEIIAKAFGTDSANYASSLNNLAIIYRRERRYADAEPLYKQSLAINEKVLVPQHPALASNILNLAALYQAQDRYSDAAPYFDRGLELIHHRFQYGFAYMSEKDRLQFLATEQNLFPGYFSFSIANHERDPSVAGKMYDVILWEKGLVGTSVSALRAQVAASGDPTAIQLFDQLTEKKSESSQLATSRPQGWADAQAKLDAEANELEQQLARRVNKVSERKALASATWKDVQKALKPDDAAVEFVRYRYDDGKNWTNSFYYAALVVTPRAALPSLILLGDAQKLESAPLASYRTHVALTRGVSAEETPGEKAAQGAAGTSGAYDAFWKPLEAALGGSKRVYVSPDGILNQIPLGVLADDSGKLLLEKFDLRLVNSTNDVLRAPQSPKSKVAVVLGNPKFDLTESEQRTAVEKITGTKSGPQPGSAAGAPVAATALPRSRDIRGGPLKPLPGTQTEVDAVGAQLKAAGWEVESYSRASALEEVVDRMQSPRIVHIATHGFFLSDQEIAHDPDLNSARSVAHEDPMLRSGLFFTGADRAESGAPPSPGLEDGVLTAYEAAQLNLQGTELVVLSACETGLGKQSNSEGVFGLRRGLQEAGVDAILMSMWSVPDRETQELMTLFYKGWLGGLDKHEAMRQAQLKEREVVRQRYGNDLPFYWGAFVLVGR